MTGWNIVDGGAPMLRINTVGSSRHRPRASTACNNCRKRKVKCNVQQIAHGEACTKCHMANVECVVSHNSDRRRYGSHRYVAYLQNRLQSLEAFIAENPQPQHGDGREQLVASDGHEKGPSFSAAMDADSEPSSQCTYMSQRLPSQDAGQNTLFSIPRADASPIADCRRQRPDIPKLPQPNGNHSSLSNIPDTRNPVADNANVLTYTPGGFAHRHGIQYEATDNSPEQGSTSWPSTELELQLSGANEDISIEATISSDSSQVQKVLLEIAWRSLSLQPWLVHEEYFLSHRQLGVRSQYYSPFLENTLLACASRASTSSAIRKLGPLYVDRAMKSIHVEFEDPTPATAQGFILLVDFETARGRDRQAWTYMGTACRMIVFDLEDKRIVSATMKDCPMPPDIAYQYTIYLSTFIYDTLWSLHLRQPRAISLSMLCTVRDSAPKSTQNRMLHLWVDLCVHIAEVSDIMTTSLPLDSHSRVHIQQIEQRLQSHYDALPPDLSASVGELDMAGYTYHIQFHCVKIVLHRALLQSTLEQDHENAAPTNDTYRYTRSISPKVIYESAVHITSLILTYKQIFGPDKMVPLMVYSIYMAATSLVSHVRSLHGLGAPADRDEKRIRLLIDTLTQIRAHFPVASRMCQTIKESFGAPSFGYTSPLGQRQIRSSTRNSATLQINGSGIISPLGNYVPGISSDFS